MSEPGRVVQFYVLLALDVPVLRCFRTSGVAESSSTVVSRKLWCCRLLWLRSCGDILPMPHGGWYFSVLVLLSAGTSQDSGIACCWMKYSRAFTLYGKNLRSHLPSRRRLPQRFAFFRYLLAPVFSPARAIAAACVPSPVAYSITQNRNPSGVQSHACKVQRACYLGFPSLDDLLEGQGQVIPSA
jgi:hypothetical protein